MDTTLVNHPLAHDPERRFWLRATGVAGGAATLASAVPIVSPFAPSERAKTAGGLRAVELAGRGAALQQGFDAVDLGGQPSAQFHGRGQFEIQLASATWAWARNCRGPGRVGSL